MAIGPFSTREVAILVWLTIAVLFSVSARSVRPALIGLLRAALNRKLVAGAALAALNVVAAVYLLWKARLWEPGLLKDTVLWFFLTGLVTMFAQLGAKSGSELRKEVVRDSIGIAIVVEYVSSTYTFSLFTELAIVPISAFLGGMLGVAGTQKEFARVEKVIQSIIAVLVLAMLGASFWSAFQDLDRLGTLETVRGLLFPIFLSVLFLPFLYLFVLYAAYETLFIRVGGLPETVEDRRIKRRMKLRLLRHFKLRLGDLRRFSKTNGSQLWGCASVEELDALVAASRPAGSRHAA